MSAMNHETASWMTDHPVVNLVISQLDMILVRRIPVDHHARLVSAPLERADVDAVRLAIS